MSDKSKNKKPISGKSGTKSSAAKDSKISQSQVSSKSESKNASKSVVEIPWSSKNDETTRKSSFTNKKSKEKTSSIINNRKGSGKESEIKKEESVLESQKSLVKPSHSAQSFERVDVIVIEDNIEEFDKTQKEELKTQPEAQATQLKSESLDKTELNQNEIELTKSEQVINKGLSNDFPMVKVGDLDKELQALSKLEADSKAKNENQREISLEEKLSETHESNNEVKSEASVAAHLNSETDLPMFPNDPEMKIGSYSALEEEEESKLEIVDIEIQHKELTEQLIEGCQKYLTNNGTKSIWEQDQRVLLKKIQKCITLYNNYRGCYEAIVKVLENQPRGKKTTFSIFRIFGHFEKFCSRLKKIIQFIELFDMYRFVNESHIDGIEVISERLTNLQKEMLSKEYDPLEYRKPDFDDDFANIRKSIDEIQKCLEIFMDRSIENCSSAMQGLELLERFKNLRNRCLDIEGKECYLFQFYHNEILLLKSIYQAEKNDTPIPLLFPPFAGKLSWCRHLYRRLERPMLYFKENTKILEKDESKPTIKLYNSLAKKLIFYEIIFHDAFVKQCNTSINDSLGAPLLISSIKGARQEFVINFDPWIRQLLEETEIIRKMNLEIPQMADVVYFKRDKLLNSYEHLKHLLKRYQACKSKASGDIPQMKVKKVEKVLMKGVTSINWSSFKCEDYFKHLSSSIDELEKAIFNKSETKNEEKISSTKI